MIKGRVSTSKCCRRHQQMCPRGPRLGKDEDFRLGPMPRGYSLHLQSSPVRKTLKKMRILIQILIPHYLYQNPHLLQSFPDRCPSCLVLFLGGLLSFPAKRLTLEWRPRSRMRQESRNRGVLLLVEHRIFSQCVFARILEEHIALVKVDSILTFVSSIAK